jgi:hypothetical protein
VTHGNSDKIRCPYCRKTNSINIELADLAQRTRREFEKPCQHCKQAVYYWACWIISVDAEKASEAT